MKEMPKLVDTMKTSKAEMMERFFLRSKSPVFQDMLRYCEQVAESNANILIIGESGTGKEIAARYIHACSARCDQPFVAINCSAYAETLLESELFGYEQGAFTGATKARAGKFELADHGTLFADEVGDINMPTQIKLLRTIETKAIERIGSNVSKQIEFRLISATNKNLAAEIKANRFREDFFYRISTIVIEIPALRKRMEDLDGLIEFFLKAAQRENGKLIRSIDPAVTRFLHEYDYPGNVRELKNIIDRMVILSEDGAITKSGLPILFDMKVAADEPPKPSTTKYGRIIPWKEFKQRSEREYLQSVLDQVNGNASEAARLLEMSSRQLFNKISEYHLRRP